MDGLTTIASEFGPTETLERLEAQVRAKGMTIFARIDHSTGATDVGLALRPTVLLIFGNARAGTPLMQENQTAGIDLPLKALVWQDGSGKTWLSYNEPQWIGTRHDLHAPAISAMAAALASVAQDATQAPPSVLY
jgi:uncharacterized protein (DUF302 family)